MMTGEKLYEHDVDWQPDRRHRQSCPPNQNGTKSKKKRKSKNKTNTSTTTAQFEGGKARKKKRSKDQLSKCKMSDDEPAVTSANRKRPNVLITGTPGVGKSEYKESWRVSILVVVKSIYRYFFSSLVHCSSHICFVDVRQLLLLLF